MKKFALTLSTLFVSGAILAGGHGYTIKKQTVTCSPGSECRIEHISDSYDEKKNLMAPDMVQTTTKTSDKNGIFKADTELDSYHTVKIVNKESVKQSYEYVYQLECEDLKLLGMTLLELKPGGVYTSSDRSVGISRQAPVGRNKITAKTRVGDYRGYQGDQATATLTIRNK